jgi:hypothetical protein
MSRVGSLPIGSPKSGAGSEVASFRATVDRIDGNKDVLEEKHQTTKTKDRWSDVSSWIHYLQSHLRGALFPRLNAERGESFISPHFLGTENFGFLFRLIRWSQAA